jgi:hypothetical protein
MMATYDAGKIKRLAGTFVDTGFYDSDPLTMKVCEKASSDFSSGGSGGSSSGQQNLPPGFGTECKDQPLPQETPFKDCAEAAKAGACTDKEMRENAALYCQKTCGTGACARGNRELMICEDGPEKLPADAPVKTCAEAKEKGLSSGARRMRIATAERRAGTAPTPTRAPAPPSR